MVGLKISRTSKTKRILNKFCLTNSKRCFLPRHVNSQDMDAQNFIVFQWLQNMSDTLAKPGKFFKKIIKE